MSTIKKKCARCC